MMETKVEMIFQNWKWWEEDKCCRGLVAEQEEFLKPKTEQWSKRKEQGLVKWKKATIRGWAKC